MSDSAEFNSSDVEVEDPPPNPFPNAGRESLKEMLEHAFEDRLSSKKQSKQLSFVKGSPRTQYMNALWHNRFTGFRENTLGVSGKSTPTGEQIERFLLSIVSRVKPKSNQVPTYGWMKSGITRLTMSCIFYFEDFTLNKHEQARIVTTVDSLFQQGKLTKNQCRERNWAGAVLVRQLVTSMTQQALEMGTLSWDVTLAKVFSILMVAALGSRTGDVTYGGNLDTHEFPFLCYKDITIKMHGGEDIDHLVAKVVIRNQKGEKTDPKKVRTVRFDAMKNVEDSLLCPIQLLLVIALRFGNVEERSIEQLVEHTKARKNKTIVWAHPERPVLCAFVKGGTGVMVEQPAPNYQLSRTMKEAGNSAGVLTRLYAHDLRRGAARDTANLRKTELKGFATSGVSAAIGHRQDSSHRSMTALYVGDLADDVWSMRVNEGFEDPFDVDKSGGSYQKKFVRLKPKQITELCQNEGLDESNRLHRRQVSEQHEKRRVNEWKREEMRKRQCLSIDDADAPGHIEDGISPSAKTTPSSDGGEVPIDPRLLEDVQSLYQAICNPDNEQNSAHVDDAVFEQMQNPETVNEAIFASDALSFVRHYSTINISSNQALVEHGKKGKAIREKVTAPMEGNSRDKVTSFIYKCPNSSFGCEYTNICRARISEHEQICNMTSNEALVREAELQFTCIHDGCNKKFETAAKLKKHARVHKSFEPSPCSKGCDPSVLYQTKYELSEHMLIHSYYTPTKCSVPDCSTPTLFKRSAGLRKHIRKAHGIKGKEIDQYLPSRKEKFQPTLCMYEGCGSKKTWLSPGEYKKHLREKHSLDDDEIEDYIN